MVYKWRPARIAFPKNLGKESGIIGQPYGALAQFAIQSEYPFVRPTDKIGPTVHEQHFRRIP